MASTAWWAPTRLRYTWVVAMLANGETREADAKNHAPPPTRPDWRAQGVGRNRLDGGLTHPPKPYVESTQIGSCALGRACLARYPPKR